MGSGFKDFAAGDVLTAADVDGYLMRQTVMTFADASSRDTALSGVLDEGMMAYLEDTDKLTFYTGSAWKNIVTTTDSGLVLVATGSVTTGTAVQIDGCFTSDYQTYRVVVDATACASATDVTAQVCASGTPASGTDYSILQLGAVWGAGSTLYSAAVGATAATVGRFDGTGGGVFAMDVFRPALSNYTYFTALAADNVLGRTNWGRHAQATAYDGIKINAGSNCTFTVRVYGYA